MCAPPVSTRSAGIKNLSRCRERDDLQWRFYHSFACPCIRVVFTQTISYIATFASCIECEQTKFSKLVLPEIRYTSCKSIFFRQRTFACLCYSSSPRMLLFFATCACNAQFINARVVGCDWSTDLALGILESLCTF